MEGSLRVDHPLMETSTSPWNAELFSVYIYIDIEDFPLDSRLTLPSASAACLVFAEGYPIVHSAEHAEGRLVTIWKSPRATKSGIDIAHL
jgi:hypothetical protein